jgi:hypothetical protein
MAYRPSPAEFPATLDGVPREEHIRDRRINGLVVGVTAVCGLTVSGGYAVEYIAEHDLGNVYKPGIGIVVSLLILALAIWTWRQNPCFVHRGDWVAIYERKKRARVIGTNEVTEIRLSPLRTVKLIFASIVCMAIGGIGVPAYIANADHVRFVIIAWLSSAFVLGLVLAIDNLLGRISSKTVQVGGVEYTLERWP